MSEKDPLLVIAAGGTGGHMFPAQALASELMRRGHAVELATDHRVGEIGRDFPARKMHVIASATLAGRSPLALARTAWKLGRGTLQARALLKSLRPDTVVGFGGYPTFPPMLAAWLTGTPSVLHEANAVMGRANRMLAARATAIATSFPLAGGTDPALASRTVRTGNPVRDAVIAAAAPYREPQPEGRFDLLVFGGSQGARFFSEVLPEALQCLEGHLRRRVRLVQQCRPEDLDRVKAAYDALGLEAELAPFPVALFHALIVEEAARLLLAIARDEGGAFLFGESGLHLFGEPLIDIHRRIVEQRRRRGGSRRGGGRQGVVGVVGLGLG